MRFTTHPGMFSENVDTNEFQCIAGSDYMHRINIMKVHVLFYYQFALHIQTVHIPIDCSHTHRLFIYLQTIHISIDVQVLIDCSIPIECSDTSRLFTYLYAVHIPISHSHIYRLFMYQHTVHKNRAYTSLCIVQTPIDYSLSRQQHIVHTPYGLFTIPHRILTSQ